MKNSTQTIPAPNTPKVPLVSLDTLWMQVGGTLCNFSCSHCFISCGPQNDSHPMMTLVQVQSYLKESRELKVKDYYITGGEVFMNKEIFEILSAILEYGPLNVLTNGSLITTEKAQRLAKIRDHAPYPLQFRISMESFDKSANDKIRGDNAFAKAKEGICLLAKVGFSPILTVTRTWEEEEDPVMEEKFIQFLQECQVPKPQVKILPGFLLGRQEDSERPYNNDERVTEKCFENYDITNLQCATSRMATGKGVYVCPILVEEDSARMGATLKETTHSFPLSHSACYTCRVTGMTCKS